MPESATLTREEKRRRTERLVTVTAQALADERGLDGFTMDELAAACEVSRRTLFNYFPSKLDAVLGNPPEIPASDLETFRAGGPHGRLVDDLAELAVVLLSTDGLTSAELERGQRVFLANPRLMLAAHERFASLTSEFADLILAREGEAFGTARARLMIRLIISVFDCCLPSGLPGQGPSPLPALTADPDRPLAEVFLETLAEARTLLA